MTFELLPNDSQLFNMFILITAIIVQKYKELTKPLELKISEELGLPNTVALVVGYNTRSLFLF
jgi:hypothetical protein